MVLAMTVGLSMLALAQDRDDYRGYGYQHNNVANQNAYNYGVAQGQQDRVPIRICATPDKKNLTGIALESAEWVLKFYNGYFDIKYPYEKLDLVASDLPGSRCHYNAPA